MKISIVSSELVASHPVGVLTPQDYTGDPEHVRDLLFHPTPNNKLRLEWMLAHDVITTELLASLALQHILGETEKINRKAEELENTLLDLRAGALKARLLSGGD